MSCYLPNDKLVIVNKILRSQLGFKYYGGIKRSRMYTGDQYISKRDELYTKLRGRYRGRNNPLLAKEISYYQMMLVPKR